MDHFQTKVGGATVHIHQAFEEWAQPTIRIVCGGEEITLVVDKKEKPQEVEIKVQTP